MNLCSVSVASSKIGMCLYSKYLNINKKDIGIVELEELNGRIVQVHFLSRKRYVNTEKRYYVDVFFKEFL